MNMISTGAFQNEMDASSKTETLTAKLVKAWEKKNAKLARTGGVSLMALSLAACGSDDTTTTTTDTTTTDTTTTDTTTTTTTPVNMTITLTGGVDAGADFTGGAGDDTFIGDNTPAIDGTSTADQLDGGEGSDTLIVYSAGAAGGLPSLTSIETLTVYDQDADITLDTIDQGSVTTANFVRGDGLVTYTVPVSVTTVGMTNITLVGTGDASADTTIAAAATATSMTLNLDRISTAAGNADEDIDITGAKIATVTINTSGTKSAVDNMDLAGAATININAGVNLTVGGITTSSTVGAMTITGAGAVSIGQMDNGVDTLTSTGTGAVTFTAPANNTAFVATLGAGADVVTTDDDGFATANTFNIDAGAGTDILVAGAAADFDTAAEAARYDNFETIRSAFDQDMSLVAGITGLQVSGGTSKTYSKMTAAQLENVTFTGNNTTSTIFTLANATGTADTANFTLASATATTNVDVVGASVVGVEHVTVAATTGTNTTGDSAFGFLANKADSVKTLTFTGTADTTLNLVANTLDVVAVAIDASGITGTGDFTIAGNNNVLVTGSSVKATANADTIAISNTNGVTYDGGAGNDAFTGSLADLVQTGSSDTKIDGGAGTDSLTIDDVTTTLTDNHFMGLSNLETFAMTNTTGDLSLTTGAGFNSAFANGVTMTTGLTAATKDVTLAAGLATVDITFTATMTSSAGTAAEVNAITTGSGNDTITFTGDATYVGVASAANGTIAISSGAGNDTISYTVGTLISTNTLGITVTAGTGQDTITATKVNAGDKEGVAHYVFAQGDSLVTAHDTITGFDMSTGSTFSDGLDFGTVAIGTVGTQNDFGTIASSSTTAGIATFDDAAGFTTALVISSTNLADVIGYLAANTATNDVVGFAYDNNSDGTNDGTMVYHNGSTDSLVLLASVTGADSIITTNASAGTGDIFVT